MKLKTNSSRYLNRMSGKPKKYYLHILSIVMLISFINLNLSLCAIIADSCVSSEMSSCCCKNSETEKSSGVKLEKKCCCEIKEITNQPAEVYLNVNQTFAKNLTLTSNFYSGIIFNRTDINASNLRILSFHSPPNESINILYSNFRI